MVKKRSKVIGISIIIPVFNSRDTLLPLTKKILDLYKDYDLEILLIDDGSHDNSKGVLWELKKEYPQYIKLVFHGKNLGEHSAIYSGFKIASKKWAITLASDYQNPPEEILNLVSAAEADNRDVVYGQFFRKKHSLLKNLMSKIINGLATIFLKKPKDLHLSNFKCVKVDIYRKIINKNNPLPLIDIEILRETKNIGVVGVIHQKRLSGESSYNLKRYISLGLRILYNIVPFPLNNIILKFYIRFFPVFI